MGGFKYKNEMHFFYTCRKMIQKNGLSLTITEENYLKELALSIYNFYESNFPSIRELRLRQPHHVLTYQIRESETKEELSKALEYMEDLINAYHEAVYEGIENKPELQNLINQQSESDAVYDTVYQKKTGEFKDSSKAFMELQRQFRGVPGVYAIYNRNKRLIYIGKSHVGVGSRVAQSVRDQGGYYASIARTVSPADVGVYEMYYIAKWDPLQNREGRAPGELSIELPDLEFSELVKIFNY